MEYLVKKSMNLLEKQISLLKNEATEMALSLEKKKTSSELNNYEIIESIAEDKNLLNSYLNDLAKLTHFSDLYFRGHIDSANQFAQSFDTYARDLIPTIVWELIGNRLLHEKDRTIDQNLSKKAAEDVSVILFTYHMMKENNSENSSSVDRLERKFFKKYAIKQSNENNLNKFLKQIQEKDKLLEDCLKTLSSTDIPNSKELIKKIKNNLN